MAKKTETETKAVAVREENQLATNVIPEHLQKYAAMGNVGMETLSTDDYIMPRLAVAQAMSPQVTQGDPLFLDGLRTGEFFNTLTGEIYGKEVVLTPLLAFKNRVLFPPRGSEANAPLCATSVLDEQGRLIEGPITPEGCDLCPHSKFLTTPRSDGTTRPECTLFYNYVSAIHKPDGTLEPVSLSLKSKMIKIAKKWNSMMRLRNLPAFTMIFSLKTVAERAPKGTFFNIALNPAGNVTAQQIQNTEKLFEQFSNRNINVDTRGADREDADFETEEM